MGYKIKRIYQWENLVRPKIISTDFTQYTSLAQIQAQWWTGITTVSSSAPTYSYGSNWIWVRSTGVNQHGWIYVQLPNAITNQNTVVMKFTWSVSSVWSWFYMSLCSSTKPDLWTSNQTEISYSQTYKSTSTVQWLVANKNVNWTKTWWVFLDQRNVQWTSWTYEAEVTLDLANGTSKWKCTSPSWMAHTSTATISTAGINCIVGTQYFIIWATNYNSWVTSYIKSASIAVL